MPDATCTPPERTTKPGVPCDTNRPPLTAREAALIQESMTLDRLIADTPDDDPDLPELHRLRDIALTEIRDSRRRTWDAWILAGIENRYPDCGSCGDHVRPGAYCPECGLTNPEPEA